MRRLGFVLTMARANPVLRLVRFLAGFPLLWLGTGVMDRRDATQVYRQIADRLEAEDSADDVLIGPGKHFS